MKRAFILILYVSFITTTILFAQSDRQKILTVETFSSQDKIAAGGAFDIAVVVQIAPEYHINSHTPADEFFIPTRISFDSLAGLTISEPIYPAPQFIKLAFAEDKVSVYAGKVIFIIHVVADQDITTGELTLAGNISYQGCNDMVCFAPAEERFSLQMQTVSTGTPVTLINQEYFPTSAVTEEPVIAAGALTTDENKAREILDKGIFYAIAAFFLVGLALNLTPCVYPVIPMTVSYFGGKGNKSKRAIFFSALLYQVGIAIAFALLGLISGLAGKQWGFLFTSPWFIVVIAIIILTMAASLFGAFELSVPSWLLTGAGKSRSGLTGALLMGLTVGVIIAPCAAGILIGLVGLIAKTGLVLKGTLLFFVMGLGLGLPYLILASFSGLLQKLPQSGMWMIWIRKLFAILLVGVALYFIVPQLDSIYDKFAFLAGLLAVFGGILLGFLEQASGYTKSFKIIRGFIGIIIILLGLFWINSAIHTRPSDIHWIQFNNQTIESLIDNEKPVFIDFYADWCAPCKQLDRETFSDEQVTEKAQQFHMLKVDCTKPDEVTKKLMAAFNVSGMPTLIFLSKSGVEVVGLRKVGFIGPDILIKSMEKTYISK